MTTAIPQLEAFPPETPLDKFVYMPI